MVEATITYQGDLRCEAIHGPSQNAIQTDAPVDNQGRGEAFSPTDLCATALGTCMVTIMGMQARTSGIDITDSKVRVAKIMSANSPRRIAELDVRITVPGQLSAKNKTILIRAAEQCPVKHSLHPDIKLSLEFVWEDS